VVGERKREERTESEKEAGLSQTCKRLSLRYLRGASEECYKEGSLRIEESRESTESGVIAVLTEEGNCEGGLGRSFLVGS